MKQFRAIVVGLLGALVLLLFYSNIKDLTRKETITANVSSGDVVVSERVQKKLVSPINLDNEEDLKKYYASRKWQMLETCKRMNQPPVEVSADVIPKRAEVETKHAIVYCSIEKTGSTFWLRMLTTIASEGKYKSPFDLRRDGAKLTRFDLLNKTLTKDEMENFLQTSTSFLFVREPYGRLLSGYVDKIYHPNTLFMAITGKKVVRTVRSNPTNESLEFGHDVTFGEFVKYIVSEANANKSVNGHFAPMTRRCNPCQYKYDFIGKMETFRQDTEWLLRQWQALFGDIKIDMDGIEKNRAADSAYGHVGFMNGARTMLSSTSYPPRNLFLRTWRHFQIRGDLSKDLEMPVSAEDAKTMTKEEYYDILVDALNKSAVDIDHVKKQRTEALVAAYNSLPLEDLEQLRLFLMDDFKYFGYDDRPDILFSRSETVDKKTEFDYFAGLESNVYK